MRKRIIFLSLLIIFLLCLNVLAQELIWVEAEDFCSGGWSKGKFMNPSGGEFLCGNATNGILETQKQLPSRGIYHIWVRVADVMKDGRRGRVTVNGKISQVLGGTGINRWVWYYLGSYECDSLQVEFEGIDEPPWDIWFDTFLITQISGRPPDAPLESGNFADVTKLDEPYPFWVWGPDEPKSNSTRYFRKTFVIKEKINEAMISVTADNTYTLYVNGQKIGADDNWQTIEEYDIKDKLRRGENLIAIVAKNEDGPAGLLFKGRIKLSSEKSIFIYSDGSWFSSKEEINGWNEIDFNDSKWKQVQVIGVYPTQPWGDIEKEMALGKFIEELKPLKPNVPVTTGNLSVEYLQWAIKGDFKKPRPGSVTRIDKNLERLKNLGVSGYEDYITWRALEREEGKFDWAYYDRNQEILSKYHGIKYIVYPWIQFPPPWYFKKEEAVLFTCLEHNKTSECLSTFAPSTLEVYERFYKALSEHFGDRIDCIYACITGDYGEGNYPIGVIETGNQMGLLTHYHLGFWCGDKYAKESFAKYLKGKYGNINELNKMHGTNYTDFSQVVYPENKENKRRWLDFVYWYHESLLDFTDKVISIVKKYFPFAEIQLKPGGGDPVIVWGEDSPGFAKVAGKYKIACQPAASSGNYFWDKWKTTAYKFYGVPLATEPAAALTPNQEVERIFSDASNGCIEYFDYGENLLGGAEQIVEYIHHLDGSKSIVDVGVFFPSTEYYLSNPLSRPDTINHAENACKKLRDVMDYEVLDERLIRDGALKNYRVLIFFAGNIVESSTLNAIFEWVNNGGILVAYNFGPISTVEGDLSFYKSLFGFERPLFDSEITKFKGKIPRAIVVDIGSENDGDYLFGDWNGPEGDGFGGSLTKRWTGSKSGIRFLVDPSSDYVLKFSLRVHGLATEKKRSLLLNGREINKLEPNPDELYEIHIPKEWLGGKQTAEIIFDVKAWVPADVEGSADRRNLGVWVNWVKMFKAGENEPDIDEMMQQKIEWTIDLDRVFKKWCRKVGNGYTLYFPMAWNPDYYELLREVVYHPEKISSELKGAALIDNEWDGVYATLFPHRILYLNPTDLPIKKEVQIDSCKATFTMEPHSIHSVKREK